MKKIAILLIICILCTGIVLTLSACDQLPEGTEQKKDGDNVTASGHPVVRFSFSTGDVIKVELYPEHAPITVENFLTYVREGYYKGTVIHRVENYVVQGGGFIIKNYQYTQKAATHDPIVGEFTNNGYKNPLSHTAGTISMARTTDPNSATSQFFFCPVDYTAWDGSYAAFGHVVDDASLAAIVRLSKVEAQNSYPLTPIILNSVDILQ